MHAWEEIQTTVDYIEAHLEQEIEITELAKLAHLSPFYYQRLFSRLVGRPVMEYVKMRRLGRACEALLQTEDRILDIALATGFHSHHYFTKAFKAAYGLTPEQYRQERPLLNQVLKPELLLKYVLLDEGVPLITEQMFLEVTRQQLLTKETYVGVVGDLLIGSNIPIAGATGINQAEAIWQEFHTCKKDLPMLIADGLELGASFLQDPGLDPLTLGPEQSFNYFAGGQSDGTTPDDLAEWVLAPGEYIVCSFETERTEAAKNIAIERALSYMLATWLPHKKIMTEPYSVEKYYFQANGDIDHIEIWFEPLR